MESIQHIQHIFGALWQDYISLNPNVLKIRDYIESKGEVIVNDHIAFRTFNRPGVQIEDLAQFFLDLGYSYGEAYEFREKKLRACHLNAPDPALPKIFLSELLLNQCSEKLVEIIDAVLSQVDFSLFSSVDFLWGGRPWQQISFQVYDFLRQESEYAAWMYVFGYRANHFTVSVNALEQIKSLESLNQILKDAGVALNQSGGEIKGGEAVYLSQSATIADKVQVRFVEGVYSVPSCFYEFALRHRLPSGDRFEGFVVNNADKIFESTHSR